MSRTFAASALHLHYHAAHLLGWRPAEFWAATPAELAASLAPPGGEAGQGIDRAELNRLMEHDNE